MPRKKVQEPSNRLAIKGEFTIYTASELKGQILGALLANNELEIDLSEVEEFDAAGLQLLVVAKKTAETLNRKLRLTGCPPAVLDILSLSGLTGFFAEAFNEGLSISSTAIDTEETV